MKSNLRLRRAGAILLSSALVIGTTGGGSALAQQSPPSAGGKPVAGSIRPIKKTIELGPAPSPFDQLPVVEKDIDLSVVPVAPKTADTMDKVMKLEQEGETFFDQKNYDMALQKWQAAYGLSLDMKYAEGEGRALTNMCRIYLERGQNTKAKELGENALEVLYPSNDKRSLARARIYLAQAYFALDNAAMAGQQLQLALESFSGAGSDSAPDAAKVMELAARLLIRQGKYLPAVKFYQGAVSYHAQGGDRFRAVSTRISVAGMLLELGFLTAALDEAQKGVHEARELQDPEMLAAALSMQGGCQYNLGEYANAVRSYEEALDIGSKSRSDIHRASLQANYGQSLASVGDRDQAKEYLLKALPVLKTEANVNIPARVLNAIGNLEAMEGSYGKALQRFGEALDLQSIAKPKREQFTVILLQNRAVAEARSGNYRGAKNQLLTALGVFKSFHDPVLEGRTYASLAEVSWSLKEIQQAEEFARKGIAVSEKINDDAALWRDYTLLAEVQISQQMNSEARDSLNSALSYFRSPQAGFFTSPERLEYPSSREDLGQRLVSLLVAQGLVEPALLAAEQLKEESFINEWHRRGGEVKPEDRSVYNDLVYQRSHLHAAEELATPNKLVEEWKGWMKRFVALSSENRALARLIAPVPTTMQDILSEVQRNNATVVDYLVGRDSTVVFVVNSLGKVSAHDLKVGRAKLQSQVATLLASSDRSPAETREVERRLLNTLCSELLPQPVMNLLPQNPDATVVVIPDGVLFNLPFAALLDAQGKYLVERHTLTLAPSMGVFLDSPPRYTHDMSLMLASGHPQAESRGASREELNLISRVFEPETVTKLVGKDADIANFQEQARGKAVVHMASSLSLNESNPLGSVLPIAGDKERKKVTADKLFELTLPSDLMVWSASSISGKQSHGNAVKVISRGLSYAGVRNVLMSLWVIPDPQRTAELVEFYKSNREGLSQAQSLRKAQMLAMSKDPSPRAWASFQLLGPGH